MFAGNVQCLMSTVFTMEDEWADMHYKINPCVYDHNFLYQDDTKTIIPYHNPVTHTDQKDRVEDLERRHLNRDIFKKNSYGHLVI